MIGGWIDSQIHVHRWKVMNIYNKNKTEAEYHTTDWKYFCTYKIGTWIRYQPIRSWTMIIWEKHLREIKSTRCFQCEIHKSYACNGFQAFVLWIKSYVIIFFRTVANYLVWRIMKNRINNLSQKFQDLVTEYNKVRNRVYQYSIQSQKSELYLL